jgi:DMSO/TMAO reductase YedYZ heme-binding membrane subunit
MILVGLIISSIFAFSLSNSIKRNATFYYIGSIILAIIAYATNFVSIVRGGIGLSLFILVMYVGALNKDSKAYKKIYPIRGQLSIMGFILLIPHALKYMLRVLHSGFLGINDFIYYSQSQNIAIILTGVIAFLIMIPLFVTSFIKIRKKMSNIKWKNLQKYSYGVYLLIYIHIAIVSFNYMLNYNGFSPYKMNFILFTVIFISYTILRIHKAIRHSNHK